MKDLNQDKKSEEQEALKEQEQKGSEQGFFKRNARNITIAALAGVASLVSLLVAGPIIAGVVAAAAIYGGKKYSDYAQEKEEKKKTKEEKDDKDQTKEKSEGKSKEKEQSKEKEEEKDQEKEKGGIGQFFKKHKIALIAALVITAFSGLPLISGVGLAVAGAIFGGGVLLGKGVEKVKEKIAENGGIGEVTKKGFSAVGQGLANAYAKTKDYFTSKSNEPNEEKSKKDGIEMTDLSSSKSQSQEKKIEETLQKVEEIEAIKSSLNQSVSDLPENSTLQKSSIEGSKKVTGEHTQKIINETNQSQTQIISK